MKSSGRLAPLVFKGARVPNLVKPLSAQAEAPRRPSGVAKKQKPGKNAARGARMSERGRGGRPHLSALSHANHLCLFPYQPQSQRKALTLGCERLCMSRKSGFRFSEKDMLQ
jgi:hypothetical protein